MFKIDFKKLNYYFIENTGIPGTFQLNILTPEFPTPVGLLIFQQSYDYNIAVLDSHVPEFLRKQGIRSYMNKIIFDSHKDINNIVTQSATKTGKLFMENTGYRQQKNGNWKLTRKDFFRYYNKKYNV